VTPIETNRLVLCRYEDGDAADLVLLANDWAISRWIPPIPHPYGDEDARDFISEAQTLVDQEREYQLAITRRSDGALMGTVGLHVASRSIPELGYWLGKPFWGKGYATEAAQGMIGFAGGLGLATLMARVFDGNDASAHVLANTGFALTETVEIPEPVRGHKRYGIYQRHVR